MNSENRTAGERKAFDQCDRSKNLPQKSGRYLGIAFAIPLRGFD
jgi:hypothetical protein